MAEDAKNPDRGERIAELQQRLEIEVPDLNHSIRTELNALAKERVALTFRGFVEGEPTARERIAAIDVQVADAEARREAVEAESGRIREELSRLQAEAHSELLAAGQHAAASFGSAMDELEAGIRDSIFEASQKLAQLRALSQKAQGMLIDIGLRDESERYTFGRFRNALSPWVVLCLGRMGKLNLNSSVSTDASEEWARRNAA